MYLTVKYWTAVGFGRSADAVYPQCEDELTVKITKLKAIRIKYRHSSTLWADHRLVTAINFVISILTRGTVTHWRSGGLFHLSVVQLLPLPRPRTQIGCLAWSGADVTSRAQHNAVNFHRSALFSLLRWQQFKVYLLCALLSAWFTVTACQHCLQGHEVLTAQF